MRKPYTACKSNVNVQNTAIPLKQGEKTYLNRLLHLILILMHEYAKTNVIIKPLDQNSQSYVVANKLFNCSP